MSETAKHTPGPWRIAGKMIDSDSHAVVARVFNEVRDPILSNVPLATMAANARLIAAAPELLEALEIYLMAGHKEARREASVIAKAAIAKATGKEGV